MEFQHFRSYEDIKKMKLTPDIGQKNSTKIFFHFHSNHQNAQKPQKNLPVQVQRDRN